MASMKYSVCASNADPDAKDAARKKAGYFASEKATIDWAREHTGVKEGQRHPLAWITEAADDSAYSVLDIEDSMKKGIISPDDLLTILKSDDELKGLPVVTTLQGKFDVVDHLDRPPVVRRDIKIGYARSYLIEALVMHATQAYLDAKEAIWSYSQKAGLMDTSALCEKLKDTARQYAFGNSEVLFVEGRGRRSIYRLLDFIWEAIATRKNEEIHSSRKEAFSRYVFSLISPNYVEAAYSDNCAPGQSSVLRYRELRLLTDMISGMTDQFSLDLYDKIASLK
jgi:dGTPase